MSSQIYYYYYTTATTKAKEEAITQTASFSCVDDATLAAGTTKDELSTDNVTLSDLLHPDEDDDSVGTDDRTEEQKQKDLARTRKLKELDENVILAALLMR